MNVSRKALIEWLEIQHFNEASDYEPERAAIYWSVKEHVESLPSSESEGEADIGSLLDKSLEVIRTMERNKDLQDTAYRNLLADYQKLRAENEHLRESEGEAERLAEGIATEREDAVKHACRAKIDELTAESERLRSYLRLIKTDELATNLKKTNAYRLADEALEGNTSETAVQPEKLTVELVAFYGGEIGGHQTTIKRIHGPFEPLALADFLKTHHDGIHLNQIYRAVGKEEDVWWTVIAEISEVEPETQYGTGEGDILVLPGYYQIGKVLKVERHPEEDYSGTMDGKETAAEPCNHTLPNGESAAVIIDGQYEQCVLCGEIGE